MEASAPVKSRKIYYGWYIVAIALLTQFATAGAQGFSLGVFMKPMSEELGWSRATIASSQSIGVVLSGIIGLFLGGIIDRRGTRLLLVFGAITTGIGFIAFSFVQELWHLYLIRSVILTVGTACSGMVVTNTAVSNWFVRKRGRAISTAVMGMALAGVILVPGMQAAIDLFQWRSAWVLLGVFSLVLVVVPTALFMRRRPEDMGLLPDGGPPTEEEKRKMSRAQKAAIAADVPWTRAEVLRTPTFWMIMVATGLGSMVGPTTMMHFVPFVSDQLPQYPLQVAAFVVGVHSLVSIVLKVPWGFVLERIQPRYVSIMAYGFIASGLVLLLLAGSSIELMVVGMLVFGIGMGGMVPIAEVIWASYFGRLSLGTVRSVALPFSTTTIAGAPLLAAVIFDTTSSYQMAFLFLIAALAVSTTLMLTLRPARRPQPTLSASANPA
jgi:sugar phosphate permease